MKLSVDEMLAEIIIKLDRLYIKVENIENKLNGNSTKNFNSVGGNVEELKKEIEEKRNEFMRKLEVELNIPDKKSIGRPKR